MANQKMYRYTLDERTNYVNIINCWDGEVPVAQFHFEIRCISCDCIRGYCECSAPSFTIQIRSAGVYVVPSYRRQGIAFKMYRLAECFYSLRVISDGKPTADGKKLRESYEAKYSPAVDGFISVTDDVDLPEISKRETDSAPWDIKKKA